MLMGIMQPGWDSRGAANTFLDQLTEWERRIQEYEGESLETFSDGMKIAVLASHAPESIRNVVRVAAGPVSGELSEFLQFGQNFDKDGSSVESAKQRFDTDGVRWQKQREWMLRVRMSRPRSERLQVQSSQEQGTRQRKDKEYLD